jgi:hypothetical protein
MLTDWRGSGGGFMPPVFSISNPAAGPGYRDNACPM